MRMGCAVALGRNALSFAARIRSALGRDPGRGTTRGSHQVRVGRVSGYMIVHPKPVRRELRRSHVAYAKSVAAPAASVPRVQSISPWRFPLAFPGGIFRLTSIACAPSTYPSTRPSFVPPGRVPLRLALARTIDFCQRILCLFAPRRSGIQGLCVVTRRLCAPENRKSPVLADCGSHQVRRNKGLRLRCMRRAA